MGGGRSAWKGRLLHTAPQGQDLGSQWMKECRLRQSSVHPSLAACSRREAVSFTLGPWQYANYCAQSLPYNCSRWPARCSALPRHETKRGMAGGAWQDVPEAAAWALVWHVSLAEVHHPRRAAAPAADPICTFLFDCIEKITHLWRRAVDGGRRRPRRRAAADLDVVLGQALGALARGGRRPHVALDLLVHRRPVAQDARRQLELRRLTVWHSGLPLQHERSCLSARLEPLLACLVVLMPCI